MRDAAGQKTQRFQLARPLKFGFKFSVLGDVAKNDNHTDGAVRPVMDRRAAGRDNPLAPGSRNQRRRRAMAEERAVLQHALNRTVQPFTRGFIEQLEHFAQRPAHRLVPRPPGQILRRLVHQHDSSLGVGAHNSLIGGSERDGEPFRLGGQRVFRLLALADFGAQLFIGSLEQLLGRPQLAAQPLGRRSRPHLRPGNPEQQE